MAKFLVFSLLLLCTFRLPLVASSTDSLLSPKGVNYEGKRETIFFLFPFSCKSNEMKALISLSFGQLFVGFV